MGSLDIERQVDSQHDRTIKNDRTAHLSTFMSSENSRLDEKQRGCVGPPPTQLYIMNMEDSKELENIRRISKELAIDIVYYVSNYKKLNASSKHAKTLRRTVDELLDRHSILFKGMVKKLDVSSVNGKSTFKNVADEMFADKNINWGRIVSIYAFGGRLAKHCADKHMYDYIDNITNFLGEYVADELAVWIQRQGGWVKFDEYFVQEATMESRLWQGLLMTAVGLGALATMVAVK